MFDWMNISNWVYGAVATVLGGTIYLLRIIFTNQKQVELLEQKLELQEQYRKKRDDKLDSQLLEIRTDIKVLMRRE